MAVDKRIVKTNNAILDAFISLAQTTPLEKITVTALAKEAGISRKTFYDRYANLDELVNTLQAYMAKRFENLFMMPIKNEHVLHEEKVMEFLEFAENNRKLLLVLKHNANDFLSAAIEQERDSMARFLETDFDFPKESAVTMAPWLITFYVEGSNYLLDKWLFTENDLTKEDVARLIMLLYKDSIFMMRKKR